MVKAEGSFILAKLTSLNNKKVEIKESEDHMVFNIYGVDNDNNTYSITFYTTIPLKKLYDFNQNEVIDFSDYIDKYDVTFEVNGLFSIIDKFKITIERYTENCFLIVFLINDEDYLLNIEISLNTKMNN